MTFTLTIDPERPIAPVFWATDVPAALFCVTSVAVLLVLFVLVIIFRKRPGIKLLGGARISLASIGGALHIVATLVTNSYLPFLEDFRTATCWLWDYWFTVIGFALFFGAIASAYLSARIAKFASGMKVGAGDSVEDEGEALLAPGNGGGRRKESKAARKLRLKEAERQKADKRDKWSFHPIQVFPSDTSSLFMLRNSAESDEAQQDQKFQIGEASDDDEQEGSDDENLPEEPEQVEVEKEFLMPPKEAEATEEEEEDYGEFEADNGVVDAAAKEETESMTVVLLDTSEESPEEAGPTPIGRRAENDASVPLEGEWRWVFGRSVFITRPGFLVSAVFRLFAGFTRRRPKTQVRIVDILVWSIVLLPAVGLCLGSLVPGVTEWKEEDMSCYTYYAYKLLVLGDLIGVYTLVAAIIVAFYVADRKPVVSYQTSLAMAQRNLSVPVQSLSEASVDNGLLYAKEGDTLAGSLFTSAGASLKRSLMRCCAFALTVLGGCGLIIRVKYGGTKDPLATVLLGHDQSLAKTVAECYTTVMPRSGRSFSRIRGHGGNAFVLSRYMRVQYASAMFIFFLGVALLIPVNMTGLVATVGGRFLCAVALSLTYPVAILMIEGVVLYDIMFGKSRRIKNGLLRAEAGRGTPSEPRTAFSEERIEIIEHFAAFVQRHKDEVFVLRRLKNGRFELKRVSPALRVGDMNDAGEVLIFPDRLALLALAGINKEFLNFSMTEAYSGDGYGSVQRRLLEPPMPHTNLSAIKTEAVSDSRYRTPAVPENLMSELYDIFKAQSAQHVQNSNGLVDIGTLQLFTGIVVHEVAFYILGLLYWTRFVSHRKTIEELNAKITGASISQPRDRRGNGGFMPINFGDNV